MKQTGFSDVNFNNSMKQSSGSNNPFALRKENIVKREVNSSNDYNPVRDWGCKFKDDKEYLENDNDFKKSFNKTLKNKPDRFQENNISLPEAKSCIFKNTNMFMCNNNMEEIINSLDEPSKSNLVLIQSFLKLEKTYIKKEINDLEDEKV